MSDNIGKRIRELRLRKGITQEELGKELGMTAQGISKWERGASPDTQLIPKIAETLGVTIDELFGIKKEQSLDSLIIDELGAMKMSDAFRRAFELCWDIEMGLTGQNTMKRSFPADVLDSLASDEYGHEYFSRVINNDGFVAARLTRNARYYFLMPEPEKGIGSYLGDEKELAETFSVLSDVMKLRILKYLYGRKNIPASIELIAKNTDMETGQANKYMNELLEADLVQCSETETDKGIIKAYTYKKEDTMLPLLVFARELQIAYHYRVVHLNTRDKPIIN